MSDYALAFFHKDGVFVALGNSLLLNDFLMKQNKSFQEMRCFPTGQPQTRDALEKILAGLEKAGVKGFFNSIVVSQMVPSEPVNMLFVQAGPDRLYESGRRWQQHIGWYGFFRAENPAALQKVPQALYDGLKA